MIAKTQKSLVVFLLSILILTVTETSASVFNNVSCTTNETFTPNSTFHTNLNTLLSSLSSNATGDVRFFNATAGGSDSDSTVYGLFMCRGDVPIALCRECIGFATQTIASSCPSSKEAVIWYNECLLRYSYRFIFSKMETWPRYQIKIPMGDPVLLHSNGFYTALGSILNFLPKEAALALTGNSKFAVKQENASANITLYGLAQCTPDLSAGDCTRCVTVAAAEFPESCCGGSIGESVLYPSCIVRYETYPFYQHSGTSAPTAINGDTNIPTHVIVIIVVLVVILVMICCIGFCFLWIKARKRRKASLRENLGLEITTLESLQFDLATIEIATNKFSKDSRIGKGGYGEVYKGILPDGQEIAVKRLSRNSGQGVEEFKNEVLLIAKLQHRNLVRLIGFCLEDRENILIYEYVPNKSLDHFLFDPQKQTQLTWPERYNIVKGIARGILYLHEDSRLKIIHRDIKPSNVLLDNNMNPKISDFGMARMVAIEQIQGSTNRVVGTYGYMSPEYAMHGHFSVKSDVFSFGVMVLEIISGKKNSYSFESCRVDDLLSNAWNQWKDESPFELVDPIMVESYSPKEVERCMQIGLLCVQENPDDRPTMGTVVSYLHNPSVEMPFPLEPAFFMHGRTRRHESYSSGHTTNHSLSSSVNMMSTTNFFPR
ncbi:Serine-threonine/tyrosine-protein kinase, catalytic domain [Sesbania bispinosa]|nr:Serine-threonine/tyrosine-protein kinase, catalytic domain [Sesbania bispinosa]